MTNSGQLPMTVDVLVVGGGPAGLAAAVALARSRRTVAVVDDGTPRNAPAAGVHNLLGQEGTSAAELLARGRGEVAGYGGVVVDGRVETITGAVGAFTATLVDGRTTTARRLLVATGLTDELPEVDGVAAGWGSTVLHCPFCHGWEVRDARIGVLVTGPAAWHSAQLFRQLSERVTVLTHTGPAPDPHTRTLLQARGITLVDGEVVAWTGSGARLADGTLVELDALVVTPRFVARSALLEQLGVATAPVEAFGVDIGTTAAAGPTGATSVAGVFLAGNVGTTMAQVSTAAGAGLMAGAAVHHDLLTEDLDVAMVALATTFVDAELWEQRYSGERVWSGAVNPQLAAEAAALAPGRALDVGCGEGADALWLAEQGWQVTGADVSTHALATARTEAERRGVGERVDWLRADVHEFVPAPGAYDLVTAQFLHLPDGLRQDVHARLAAAVAPGGTLLLVLHDPSDLGKVPRPSLPGMFVTADVLASTLDPEEFEVEIAEARPREADIPGHGRVTIADTVLRARRRG